MNSTVHDGPIAAVELTIGGMTCASCAARIEKKLNRMDGVEASVNYATEKAHVSYTGDVRVADLIATVVKTGYTAAQPPPRAGGRGGRGPGPPRGGGGGS
ncbi:heavy metal-associated domain-containing protein, partial [Streptomyces subrutilus]|uniref:heavy metal-associated domain-containing protein n=1 Tax=Streptomyces subrutilus TaxID=36818 RepID=UPI003442784C